MLTLLLGTDWVTNRQEILKRISENVKMKQGNSILIVPELISHDTERRLCQAAGDTCSRFAEVLTFSRLGKRVSEAAGKGAMECLDNGGRVVAMASAARQLYGQLKSYASVETKPEFLTELVDAVDEFKRCCISPQDLLEASKKTDGAFAQKLEELSLLLGTYDAICSRGKRDPRDLMTWVLEQLEDSPFGAEHQFFVDGFPDFTRQHMAILEHLIETSEHVVVSLTCDKQQSSALAYEKAGATAAEFIRIASKCGTEVEVIQVQPKKRPLYPLTQKIFQGKLQTFSDVNVSTIRTDTVYHECQIAAEKILQNVLLGDRFRDISVVCTDMGTYENVVSSVFSRCKIPCYISGTEDVLEKSVIATVLAALDAALGGFDQQDVFQYLKSMLSPLSLSQCDMLENYAIMWSISGKKWLKEFKNHPLGLKKEWNEFARRQLKQIESARQLAMNPLKNLSESFEKSICVKDQITALYAFLEEVNLAGRLTYMADSMDAAGDNRSAQILNQLWEILLSALEQLYDVLGDTSWDGDTFVRLLKLLLSQYDVGTIPPVLDTVTVGPVSAMRCQQAKHVYILGAMEGNFPGYAGSAGVLTDQERVALRDMGVPLTGGSVDGLQAEFADIYGVCCGARESLHLSCPSGQPSFIYNRVRDMAGHEENCEKTFGAVLTDKQEAASYLNRTNQTEAAKTLGIQAEYDKLGRRKDYQLGFIQRENIEKLYGTSLNLSASQINLQEQCRLSYFLKYGVKAKERKPITVDPAEFGTYVHDVLEKTGRSVIEQGGFQNVSLEDVQKIASQYSDQYARENFTELESKRLSYLFQRNTQELMMVVEELWQELKDSKFKPVGFEVGFGKDEKLDPIPIPGTTMNAQLQGFVDRVDVWQEDHENYFRVVDYKTGKKDFDYCDVFNGIGLQMLLYLYALEASGESLLTDNPTAAGVQYFPARVPFLPEDGPLPEGAITPERRKEQIRKGLVLSNKEVLDAINHNQKFSLVNYKTSKDGTLSGDLATGAQFKELKKYVFKILGEMVDDIASGNVNPNPYTRGNAGACTYCPYSAVCHPENVEERRNYKAMSAKRFFEEIHKEVE